MFLSKIITNIYKKAVIHRCDYTDDLFCFDYTDFEGMQKENYPFVSKNGAKLNGAFYFYSEPKKDKLVIFDHGMGAGHRPYMREIETLCKAGYLVYSYDHEGCADSEGDTIRGLSGSLSDLDDCLNALKKSSYYENREIVVMGHSWGGFSTKNIAALHPEIKKTIPIAGCSSIDEALSRLVPKPLRFCNKYILDYEEKLIPGYTKFRADKTLAESNVKALILHSSDDPILAADVHQYPLMKTLNGNPHIEFLTLDNRGHNPTYSENAVKLLSSFYSMRTKLIKKKKLKTSEQKKEFLSRFDFLAMTEQDTEVWNKIFDFIES